MARSPLTLAASVTAALPRAGVVRVGALTEDGPGRFDSAVVDLADGRRVVVRAPVDESAAAELAAQVRVLRALTPGVRSLLPFRAPEVLGDAPLHGGRAVVVDLLPGYRVDAAHLPGGAAAAALGEAVAAVHALPQTVVRGAGLPARSPDQVRDEALRLLDRADATRRLPAALARRWRRAVLTDRLWRFAATVTLDGAAASAFLFDEDDHTMPVVVGLLDWHGLGIGDPAVDLRWLASAPAAAADVLDAYTRHAQPDALLRERARLHAELEFARWLVHGFDEGRVDIVDDAVDLLTALADGVGGEDLLADDGVDVDDALALLDSVVDTTPDGRDTSLQTDAYDPEMLSLFVATEQDAASARTGDGDGSGAAVLDVDVEDVSTAPIDVIDHPRTTMSSPT